MVVENVCGAPVDSDSESAWLVRNTSAIAGAGTGMAHEDAPVLHWMVVIFSLPMKRPSDSKLPPNVSGGIRWEVGKKNKGKKHTWPAQVILTALLDTAGASRDLKKFRRQFKARK